MKTGDKVRTVEAPDVDDPRGWTPTGLATRRWDVEGMIVAEHSGHGPYFDVQHDDDGSIGHYERGQLMVLTMLKVKLFEHQAKMLLQLHGVALREGYEGLDAELVGMLESTFPHLKRDNYFRKL